MVAIQRRVVYVEFYRKIADFFVDEGLRAHSRVVEFYKIGWAIIKENLKDPLGTHCESICKNDV